MSVAIQHTASSNLSWAEHPTRGIVRMAWPIAIANLSYASMTLCDTLFVSRLGEASLAGVGLGGICAITVTGFGFGVLRGTKVLIAQGVGAGRDDSARLAGAALLCAALLAVGVGVVGQLFALGVGGLGSSAEAGRAAADYLSIRTGGAVIPLLFVALREVRHGIGDTRTTLIAALGGNVVNIGLDYLAIFEFELGVRGAAWATLGAFAFKLLVLLSVQARDGIRFEGVWKRQRRIFAQGLPTGAHFTLDLTAMTMLSVLLAGISDADMAAHQIGLQISAFAFLPALALSEGASVLSGQALGAGRQSLVRTVARTTLLLACVYALACAGLLLIGGSFVVGLFTSNQALMETSMSVLAVVAGLMLVDAAAVVAHGVLRGVSDQRFSAVAAVACAWGCTLPLGWLLACQLGWGAPGAWLAMTAELSLAAGLLWWRLEGGGWVREPMGEPGAVAQIA